MRMTDDLEGPATMVSGQGALVQDIYHMLTTEPGTMATNAEFGFGLTNEMLVGRDPLTMPALASSIQAALEDDDRIDSAEVALDFLADGSVNITIEIAPSRGPSFRLVGPLSSLLTELTNG